MNRPWMDAWRLALPRKAKRCQEPIFKKTSNETVPGTFQNGPDTFSNPLFKTVPDTFSSPDTFSTPNMDFDDFVEATDPEGIFHGFAGY